MNGFLESWMDPLVWSNTWEPLPLHLGPHQDIEINIRRPTGNIYTYFLLLSYYCYFLTNFYQVTSEEVAEFKERGYWVSPKVNKYN